MVQPNECPTCGRRLPPDAPAGVCPRCLLKAGLSESERGTGDDATLADSAKQNEDQFDGPVTESEMSRPGAFPSVGTEVRYFGDYELLDEIARGGMGVVFRARQTRLNRMVALKMILSGRLATEADVRRFQIEAEAAAQLDHPGIVPVFEVGQHDGHHFYSMALVEGESLAERISQHTLLPAEAALLLKKTTLAVAFAHEHGVIHRDLKPSNILIDHAGDPRVADFGLAKQKAVDSSLTRSGQTLGTPSFMAPEQASGSGDQVNEAADIYSLGAILFCALTGRPPFVAETPAQAIWKLTHDDPLFPRKLNPDIPADLEAICLKCLEKSPSRRYESAADLHDDLSRFLNHQSVQARHATVTSRALRWSRRNRRGIAIALATSAAVLLAVIGIQWVGQWYGAYRTGFVSIGLESGPTAIEIFRDGDVVAERKLTIATDETIKLPAGDYEIWAPCYGQHWKANVLPQQTLPLNLRNDARHEYSLRIDGYLTPTTQLVPNRRQGRADLLTETLLHIKGVQRRTLELHHGWNGDRLWGAQITSWETWRDTHAESSKQFIDFAGVSVTSDFDGDGAPDVAVLKANHYMVLSVETGEVILDAPVDYESRFKNARVSFGEFMDVNQDDTLDIVLCIGGDWLAIDGRDGSEIWRTTRNGFLNRQSKGQLITTVNGEPILVFAIESRTEPALLQIYKLSNGQLFREFEFEPAHLQPLGVLDGAEEPLLVTMFNKEIRAIGVMSGEVTWSLPAENWLGFTAEDQPAAFTRRGAIALEDLTGDGVTDVVMAERRVGETPAIELMMIDGRLGQPLWQSSLEANGQILSWAPAVYAEPAAARGKTGRLYCVDFEATEDATYSSTLRLNSLNPITGDILWRNSLPLTTTHGAALHQPLDDSRLPTLLIESGGDPHKRILLQVDKETGQPIRRFSLEPSAPLLMIADLDQDGLADLMTGDQADPSATGGVARVNVSVYRGHPRECWRRPVESFPLADIDGDGVSDCLAMGLAPTLVSGASGQSLQQFPSLRYEEGRTMVTAGSGDGVVAQLAEEGYGELNTFVRVFDVRSGDVIAEINDYIEGYWGSAVSGDWSKLYFPDLDGDGQPEIAITGKRPWRVYSTKTRERVLLGSGIRRTEDPAAYPAALIGHFEGSDGRDRLVEVGANTRSIKKQIAVRVLDAQGRREWSTSLDLNEGSYGDPSTAGVRTAVFDGDGVPYLVISWGANRWILEQDTGRVKLHSTRNAPIRSLGGSMVQTENGRIVAYGPDGATQRWEHRLPETASNEGMGDFLHEGEWSGAVVVRRGNELFAIDKVLGRKLWRCNLPSHPHGRFFLLSRKSHSTPLIVSTTDQTTVCREAFPVDAQWNYLLPSPLNAESASPRKQRSSPE